MKKNVLPILLVLALAAGLLPMGAHAAEIEIPFTVSAGSVSGYDAAGYTPYAWNGAEMAPADPVPLYTVTLPEEAERVALTFPGEVLAYNYSPDGTTWLAGIYEDAGTGAASAAVSVDADGDGTPDCIQVQTPYDADWNSTVLYAITFDFTAAAESTPAPEAAEAGAAAEADALRAAIAARYAAAGVAGDENAPWLAADMMAWAAAFPEAAATLSPAQMQAVADESIAAIEGSEYASVVAKYDLALVAMGFDPARLTAAGGAAVDGKAKLDALVFEGAAPGAAARNVYTLPYLIIAYQQFSGTEDQLALLTDAAVSSKEGWMDTTWGVDGMTPMFLALAPYYGTDAAVTSAVDEALAALRACQAETGSVGNAASDGLAIAGLTALGIDPASVKHPESGKSLVDALLSAVSESGDGFEPTYNSYSTEQGFRGLIALAGGPGYRLYDFSGRTLVPAAATPMVVPSPQGFTLDGEAMQAEAYNIAGRNYFKLRDLALLLSGSDAQFEVVFDPAENCVNITTGAAYTPVGGEGAAGGGDKSASCVPSPQSVTVDGEPVALTAYNIGDNNYFQLAELGAALGFGVSFDAETNTAAIRTAAE